MKEIIRKLEDLETLKYSRLIQITPTLFRYVDDVLKDKYDNNYFYVEGDLTKDDYLKAIEFQKARGDKFLKFVSNEKYTDSFGMEEGTIYAMALMGDTKNWKVNNNIIYREPTKEEMVEIELKHYGECYGEEFARKNAIRNHEIISHLAAYKDNQIVGCLSYFANDEAVCIDDLIVDRDHRKQYIATSLLKQTIEMLNKKIVFLHADADDTPKDMYARMGFEIKDVSYEYFTNSEKIFG